MTKIAFTPSRVFIPGLMAIAALMAGSHARAQSSGKQFTSVTISTGGSSGYASDSDRRGDGDFLGSTSSVATHVRPDGDGSASVSSGMSIAPGMIHADISLTYQGRVDVDAGVDGWMFDGIRVTAEGQDTHNNPIQVVYSMLVDERRSSENHGERALFGAASGGLSGISGWGLPNNRDPIQIIQEGSMTRVFYQATVYNDQWSSFYWGMRASAYAYNVGPGLTTDYGSTTLDLTYYWGGIQSVTDRYGSALTYSLQSTSGYDFRNSFAPAVPEPSSMGLMAAGGLLLVVVQRRRRGPAGAAATSTVTAT